MEGDAARAGKVRVRVGASAGARGRRAVGPDEQQPGEAHRTKPAAAAASRSCRSHREEVDKIAGELGARRTGRSSCSQPRPGCGRARWLALERRDVDKEAGAVTVDRALKTAASRRRVPLSGHAHGRRSRSSRRGSTPRCCSAPSTSTTGVPASGSRRYGPRGSTRAPGARRR